MKLLLQDIVHCGADVIVNSANPTLLAGGGVSAAIHRAAGPRLQQAAIVHAPLLPGQAIVTPGFDLDARYVIHTVAPRYLGGTEEESRRLADAYRAALELCVHLEGISSVAFPSLGTGVYRWPLKRAAGIAIGALRASPLEETWLCVIDQPSYEAYSAVLDQPSTRLR